MTPRSDHGDLLDEVFAELAPEEFRQSVLDGTLGVVRRRRRRKRAARLGSLAAAVALCMGIGVLRQAHTQPGSCEVVHSRAAPTGMIVATQPLQADSLLASVQTIGEVRTLPGGKPYRVIGDAELLALAGSSRAALIRTGRDSEELILLGP